MIVHQDNPQATEYLIRCLKNEGVAITPCDTIYGIVGKAPETDGKMRTLKGRSESKLFIVLQPTVSDVSKVCLDEIPDILLSLWPGPLTLVVRSATGPIGCRVPGDGFLRNVLRQTGPLYSTSVNFANRPSLWRITDITAQFESKVDLIIDGGDLEGRLPSTVLDISAFPYRILRDGAAALPEEVLSLCR